MKGAIRPMSVCQTNPRLCDLHLNWFQIKFQKTNTIAQNTKWNENKRLTAFPSTCLPPAFFTLFPIKIDQDDLNRFLVRLTKNWQILIVFESHFARSNSCFCEVERLLGDRHQIRRCFAQQLKIIASDVRRQLAGQEKISSGKYKVDDRREKIHWRENI